MKIKNLLKKKKLMNEKLNRIDYKSQKEEKESLFPEEKVNNWIIKY